MKAESNVNKVEYERRKEFNFLFTSKSQNIAVVAARGMGKTVAAVQSATHIILSSRKRNSFGAFFSATLTQAAGTVEPIMRTITAEYPNAFWKYNKAKHKYSFFISKNDVRELFLFSYENPETKRGFHPDIIVLDECGSMPYNMFGLVIEPMLAPPDGSDGTYGRLIAIGTAQGRNRFYELIERGKSDKFPDWESYVVKASDNHLLDSKYLRNIRNSLTEAEYAQEYECDFNANVLVGSVYISYLNRYTRKNISDEYDYDPSLPVWTSWDLGHSNNTAIWFFQVKGDVVTFIDFYEDSGYDITHYANEVLSKPYNYRKAILPWDAGAKNIRSPVTISEMLATYGIKNQVLENTSVKAGIDSARLLLKTARFNKTKCKDGIEHLESYRFKVDYKTGIDKQQPLHDKHSDAADAFRYASVSKNIWKSFKNNDMLKPIRRDYNIFD